MDVRLPDGTVVKNVPDGMSKADLVTKLKSNGMAVPDSWAGTKAAAPQSAFDRLLDTARGVGENALHMASGAVAQPAAGINGLGQIATNALGITNQDPDKTIADTQNALTYEPKTPQGQAIQQGIGKIVAPAANFVGKQMDQYGQNMSDATGSPLVGALAKGALGALPQALGAKIPELGAANIADAGQAALAAVPRQAALQSVKDAGYIIPPSEMISAPVGKALTGVAGKDQINRAFSLANQTNTDRIAAKDLSIPADVPFDPAAVAKVKANANAVYEAARKSDQTQIPQKSTNGTTLMGPTGAPLTKAAGPVVTDAQYVADVKNIGADRANVDFGTPIDKVIQELQATLSKPSISTNGLISKINELREDARTNLNTIDDTTKKNLGRAQQQAADALEGQLGRYLQSTGQPGMFSALQHARTTLAKAKTIEAAMGADGRVDAAAINNYRNNGGYVDGGLKTIADAADTLGNVVKNTSKVNAPEPFSKMQFLASMGGLTAGGGTVGGHVGAITGGAAATLLGAPAAARGFLGTHAYQATLGAQTPTANLLSRLAAKSPSPFAGLLATPDQGANQ
jgi:hypothetical protein